MDLLNPDNFSPAAMKALLESAKNPSLQMQYQQQLASQLQAQQILQSLTGSSGASGLPPGLMASLISSGVLPASAAHSSSNKQSNQSQQSSPGGSSIVAQQLSSNSSQQQSMSQQQIITSQMVASDPYLAALQQIQNAFATGSAPSMVIAPTHIPLYPGYAQVPAGAGYIQGSGSKYNQLLQVIEEMSKDLRPSYAGSKMSGERFKRGIAQARILLRECMMETERSSSGTSQSSVSKLPAVIN